MKQIKIAFIGAYGTNLGDNAILLGMLKSWDACLKKKKYDAEIVVYTNYPEFLMNSLKNQLSLMQTRIIFYKITNPVCLLRGIGECNILIMGGGKLIADDWRIIHSTIYFMPFIFAHLLNKYIAIYSIGASIPHSRTGRFFTNVFMGLAQFISVRDNESKIALQKNGVIGDIYVYPDPATPLVPLESSRDDDYLKELKKEHLLIGISARFIFKYYQKNEKRRSYLLDELSKSLNYFIKDKNAIIFFIPFNQHPKRWFENDFQIAVKLKEKIANKDKFVIFAESNPEAVISFLSHMDILIGVRLHSLILATIAKIPVIGIVGDSKVSSFMNQIGLAHYLVSPDEKKLATQIKVLLNKALKEKKQIHKLLDKKISKLSDKTTNLPETILSDYEKR